MRSRTGRVALLLVSSLLASLLACAGSPEPKGTNDAAAAAATADAPSRAAPELAPYPKARVSDHSDDYHGTRVADPFRWLEEGDSEETKAWIAAENAVTFAYLEQIPEREQIHKRLTALWDFERFGVPWKRGGRYFFSKNDGLQNQSVMYWTDDLAVEPTVAIDPNKLSEDGTVALNGFSVSDDGKRVAYGLSTSGSDWQEWHVRDLERGADLDDHLRWIKFSGASWSHDNEGFFYGGFDAPEPGKELEGVNYFQKLYYHRVGTPQSKDRLIYEDKAHKEWEFGGSVTDDGKYLIIHVSVGTDPRNMIYYAKLGAHGRVGKIVELIPELEAEYTFVDNDGPVFWFNTDSEAPRGRLIEIDTRKPARAGWKTLISESKDTMRGVSRVADRFVVNYMADAHSRVDVVGLDGAKLREVELPGLGSAGGFGGRRDDPETFYGFTSFTQPETQFRYDVTTGESTVFRKPTVDIDPTRYETKQVFYTSKDGTKIPMFIVHRQGIELDGTNPTYLYGYGGFNVPLMPGFSVADMVWLEMGGVYAQANLRGGGEYGKEWHEAGTKRKKQNVFDDFIGAAEYLIAQRYTQPAKLAIGGRSNGGLLVGACMTQRPDLFGAVLAGVGVMDMLRFHKFTIGWAWVSDYGSSENPDEFSVLRAYSPYHNLREGTAYPATMVFTADHDDRVVPLHSFKFAAELQRRQTGEDPVLIRIETKAGHGAGKPTSKRIDEWADLWGFLVANLDMRLTEFG